MNVFLGQKLFIDPTTMTAKDLHPWDFAVSLSRINRYSGNGRYAYSVAQHSVILSHAVPRYLAFPALIHDMPETIIGDMNGLLKVKVPAVEEYEHKVMRRICTILGVKFSDVLAVGPWDKKIRIDEIHALFDASVIPATIDKKQGLGVNIVHITESMARSLWLDRFHELCSGALP